MTVGAVTVLVWDTIVTLDIEVKGLKIIFKLAYPWRHAYRYKGYGLERRRLVLLFSFSSVFAILHIGEILTLASQNRYLSLLVMFYDLYCKSPINVMSRRN